MNILRKYKLKKLNIPIDDKSAEMIEWIEERFLNFDWFEHKGKRYFFKKSRITKIFSPKFLYIIKQLDIMLVYGKYYYFHGDEIQLIIQIKPNEVRNIDKITNYSAEDFLKTEVSSIISDFYSLNPKRTRLAHRIIN